MAKFKLLAGQHQAEDRSVKPVVDPVTKRERFPTKTFLPGQIVESDSDLVAKFGREKFQLISGGGEGEHFPAQTTFPQGQVASGFQVSTGAAENTPQGQDIVATTAKEAARLASGTPKSAESEKEKAKDLKEAGKDASTSTTADKGTGPKSKADLDNMTVVELREYATDEEIELRGATHKDELVKVIAHAKRFPQK